MRRRSRQLRQRGGPDLVDPEKEMWLSRWTRSRPPGAACAHLEAVAQPPKGAVSDRMGRRRPSCGEGKRKKAGNRK